MAILPIKTLRLYFGNHTKCTKTRCFVEAPVLYFIKANHDTQNLRSQARSGHAFTTALKGGDICKLIITIDPAAISALDKSVHDSAVRMAVIHALGKIEHPSAILALENIIGYWNSDERIAAVEALRNNNHPSAISILEVASRHDDRELRKRAVEILNKIWGKQY